MARSFREHYAHFVARTGSLASDFRSPLPKNRPYSGTCPPIHEYGRLKLVIRLQMLWGEYCRELVVSSALGDTRTLGGTVLTRVGGVSSATDIINIATAESGGGRLPPWHRPRFAVQVAARLSVRNLFEIKQGLSAVSPADDLLAVRNYVVHPTRVTKARYLTVTQRLRSSGVGPHSLLSTLLPGGATLFEAWVADLQTIALVAAR